MKKPREKYSTEGKLVKHMKLTFVNGYLIFFYIEKKMENEFGFVHASSWKTVSIFTLKTSSFCHFSVVFFISDLSFPRPTLGHV